mgnify:CR=1 FL=1
MSDHPIIRRPATGTPHVPVVLSIPHFGVDPFPGITEGDYADRLYRSFRYGYADAYAAELYGDMHEAGATVVATRISRLFLDLNRNREDFEITDGEVRSNRGVFRTHTIHDNRVLQEPLAPGQAERWLSEFYDPYYAAVERVATDMHAESGYATVIDGHTGSPRRLKAHDVVLGTGRGKYCTAEFAQAVQALFHDHGFNCTLDLRGYAGGAVVRRFGRPDGFPRAIQIEVNAGLIMRCTRRAYAESLRFGLQPAYDPEVLIALADTVRDVIRFAGSPEAL